MASARTILANQLREGFHALTIQQRSLLQRDAVALIERTLRLEEVATAGKTAGAVARQVRQAALLREQALTLLIIRRFAATETAFARGLREALATSGETVSRITEQRILSLLHRIQQQQLAIASELGVLVEQVKRGQFGQSITDTLALLDRLHIETHEPLGVAARLQAIRNTRDGTPLARHFADELGKGFAELRQTLQDGIRHSKGPQTIARDLRKALPGLTRDRAIRIARTETLRAYRQAAIQEMGDYDEIIAWRWTAQLGPRTCMACVALHGTIHPLDEEFGSHPDCRCSPVPVTRLQLQSLYGINGIDWFAKQPAPIQRKMMGQAKHRLYENGVLGVESLVDRHPSEWGPTASVKSLRQLRTERVLTEKQVTAALTGKPIPKRGAA